MARTLAELRDERPVDRTAVDSLKGSMVLAIETFREDLEPLAGDPSTGHGLDGKSGIADSER